MSILHAEFFLEKMLKDDDFREAIIRIENIEKKIAYIHRRGFRFSAGELETAFFNTRKHSPLFCFNMNICRECFFLAFCHRGERVFSA